MSQRARRSRVRCESLCRSRICSEQALRLAQAGAGARHREARSLSRSADERAHSQAGSRARLISVLDLPSCSGRAEDWSGGFRLSTRWQRKISRSSRIFSSLSALARGSGAQRKFGSRVKGTIEVQSLHGDSKIPIYVSLDRGRDTSLFCRGSAAAGMDCRSRETGTDAIYGELADAIAYWLWPAREGLRGLMAGESLLTLEISIAEERSDSSSIESLLPRPDSPQPDAKSEQERNEQIERVAPPGVPSRERWAAGAGFCSTDGAVATGRPEVGQLFAADRAYGQKRCFVPSFRVTGRRALRFDPRRSRE